MKLLHLYIGYHMYNLIEAGYTRSMDVESEKDLKSENYTHVAFHCGRSKKVVVFEIDRLEAGHQHMPQIKPSYFPYTLYWGKRLFSPVK